jgi:HlyD family secretion protein
MTPAQQAQDMRETAEPPKAPELATSRRRRGFVAIGILVLMMIAGVLLWRGVFARRGPDNIVSLSGRIEGDDSAVAPKLAGRLVEVRVREGDAVNAGDVIAVLDDEQLRAREDQARASLAQMEARSRAALEQIAVLREQLHQTELQTNQSKLDAAGRVKQAEAELAAAQAQLAQQQAAYQLAAFDRDAYIKLAETGAASERQSKQAISTADQQAAAVAAAQKRVEAADGALASVRAMLANPDIRAAETAAVQKQISQQNAEVASATAQIAQQQAALAEAQANRKDLVVRAPFTGTIVTRAAEPGEVMMAGTTIVTLVDLSRVYLRGFIPEGQIGLVKVGQAAQVFLDSSPNTGIEAHVSRIDPQATFTPENTYFRDDRVKQVVGVKLQLKDGTGYAKPGMPADGEILVSGTWPKGNRRSL